MKTIKNAYGTIYHDGIEHIKQVKKSEIETPEDIRDLLMENKAGIKWTNWEVHRPHMHTISGGNYNSWHCPETDMDIIIYGIGEKKVRIYNYWYSYKTIYDAIHRSYKLNSTILNSLCCLLISDYYYKQPTDADVYNVIKNRKNPQYLVKSEIPKYIPLSFVKEVAKKLELPILKKQL